MKYLNSLLIYVLEAFFLFFFLFVEVVKMNAKIDMFTFFPVSACSVNCKVSL